MPARKKSSGRSIKKTRFATQSRVSGLGAYKSKQSKTRSIVVKKEQPKWYNKGGNVSKGVGSTLGSYFGPIGSAVGGGLGSLFHSLTGIGDYKMKRNTLLDMGNAPPQICNSKSKSTIIRHREYLGDVYSSVGFVTQYTLPINPGLASSFPWLSQVASSYQEYRANGIVYEFKSTCGDAISSTNNSLGTVMMSTQYNANAVPFINKIQMENEEFSCDTKPSTSIIHGIECERKQTPLACQYIRSAAVPANDSPEFYDLALFQLSTNGQQTGNGVLGGSGSVNLGELWCSFEFELIKPQLVINNEADTTSILSYHSQQVGVTNALPLGTGSNPQFTGMSTLALGNTIQIFASNNFQVGDELLLSYIVLGGSVTFAPATVTVSSAATINSVFDSDSAGAIWSPNSGATATSATLTMSLKVLIAATAIVITIAGNGTLPSSANVDLLLTQMNNRFA